MKNKESKRGPSHSQLSTINSQLPKGYQRTEAGVIPNDWKVLTIGEVGEILGGRQRSPSNIGEQTKYLRVANVFDGYIDSSDVLEMPFSASEKARFMLHEGDILLNEGQSIDLVGRSAIYRGIPENCCFQNTLIRFRAMPQIAIDYAQSVFQHYLRTGVFAAIAMQTTSIAHLGAGRFASLHIAVPSFAEQEAIASALSDADGYIESLEKLIAKKRLVKQGTMQELLSGKRRLPGFSGKWQTKKLSELGEWTGGTTPSMQNTDYWQHGTIPWISSGDVKSIHLNTTAYSIAAIAVQRGNAILIPANSIIMVTRSGILRKYFPVAIVTQKMAINQDIKAILPDRVIMPDFLLQTMIANGDKILSRCLKSGTTVESIEFSWLKSFSVNLPPLAEQSAIVKVLSYMDAEIEALEAKLAKARKMKEGMMQELLTGRIRLI